jgi:peptidoglycan-N-acetylglucosamine deacetylase
MQRSTRSAFACALIAACLPPALARPGAAPAPPSSVALLAAPIRVATGPDAPSHQSARQAVRAPAPPGRAAPRRTAAGRGPAGQPTATRPVTTFAAHGRTITLTFDDGPDPRWTPTVLDLLRQYRAHAIFCMVGLHAAAHPDLVRRVVAEGHALCDHTWTHDEHLPERPASVIDFEIGNTAAVLTRIAGAPPRYYRAPAGNWSTAVLAAARSYGMTPLGWSVDPGDWARPGTGTIIDRVLAGAAPGAVVLMHDGYGERAQSVAALRVILAELSARGYRFTIPT